MTAVCPAELSIKTDERYGPVSGPKIFQFKPPAVKKIEDPMVGLIKPICADCGYS